MTDPYTATKLAHLQTAGSFAFLRKNPVKQKMHLEAIFLLNSYNLSVMGIPEYSADEIPRYQPTPDLCRDLVALNLAPSPEFSNE